MSTHKSFLVVDFAQQQQQQPVLLPLLLLLLFFVRGRRQGRQPLINNFYVVNPNTKTMGLINHDSNRVPLFYIVPLNLYWGWF